MFLTVLLCFAWLHRNGNFLEYQRGGTRRACNRGDSTRIEKREATAEADRRCMHDVYQHHPPNRNRRYTMPKTARTHANSKPAAVATFPRVVCFDYVTETPGAYRYQEVAKDGVTPLVTDADGAMCIGALYLRKAQFAVAPKRIVVTIGE